MDTAALAEFIVEVQAGNEGECGCHWCCSLPASSSPTSGSSVGFPASIPFKVGHELLKTHFGQ